MLSYILKFSAILAIFLAFYKLFLEKENVHVFKRYYLLATIVIAFGIPCITFTTYIDAVVTDTTFIETSTLAEAPIQMSTELPMHTNYWLLSLWSIYSIGLLLFGSKFIRNLWKIITKVQQNPKQPNEDVTYVLLKDKITPHTFLKYIFFNKQTFEQHHIPKEVFWHEETHAKQRHSIDIILLEALQVIFWFNPLIYIAKAAIKLNHEFLADQGVLHKGVIPSTYQQILLHYTNRHAITDLATAINHSSIKKRFTIMKSNTSKRTFILRSLLLIPVTAFTLYSFSNTETITKEAEVPELIQEKTEVQQKEPVTQVSTIKTEPNHKGKVTLDSYFAGVRFVTYKTAIQYKDTIVGQDPIFDKKYEELTEAEKKSKDIKFMLHIPKPMEKRTPTNAEMEKYQNKKVYAIWIDGESVDNSALANYKRTDFASYSGQMTITKTGRSEKYPQPFWCMFYTHDYFKAKKFGEQKTKYLGKEVMTFKSLKKVNKNFGE